MNSFKPKSAMLMTKGIIDMRTSPPRLIATILTFHHPKSHKEVTLLPLPNLASPAYLKRVLDPAVLTGQYDRILCEDGRLPYEAGTLVARRQEFWRRLFPFFNLRPVVADGTKYDGILVRDPVESRMAYHMILEGWNPPVDPRARRGVERIATYEENSKVAVPWGAYHLPYFRYRLQEEGYTLTGSEEVEIMGIAEFLALSFTLGVISFAVLFVFLKLLFS